MAQSLMIIAMLWLQKHMWSPLVLCYREKYLKRAASSFFTHDLNTSMMGLNNHFAMEKAYA